MVTNPAILIVDDSEDVRILMKLKLKKLGHQTLEASDGEEALDILDDNHEIKIVLMDVMMPNLSGFDVLKKMKMFKEKRNIKVCFLTADTREDSLNRAKALGADGFITKPVKSNILEIEINSLIKLLNE